MNKQFFSLALAASLVLSTSGCSKTERIEVSSNLTNIETSSSEDSTVFDKEDIISTNTDTPVNETTTPSVFPSTFTEEPLSESEIPAADPQLETSLTETDDPVSSASSEETNFTLDRAKEIFLNNHPNAQIEVSKTEGNVYYIQGYEGNTIYKMKIDKSNGDIYLDKTITTGRKR